MFWIASGLYAIGVIYFGVFGSGELQKWGRAASEGECEREAEASEEAAAPESPASIEEGCGEKAKLEAHYERTTLQGTTSEERAAVVKRVTRDGDQTTIA